MCKKATQAQREAALQEGRAEVPEEPVVALKKEKEDFFSAEEVTLDATNRNKKRVVTSQNSGLGGPGGLGGVPGGPGGPPGGPGYGNVGECAQTFTGVAVSPSGHSINAGKHSAHS